MTLDDTQELMPRRRGTFVTFEGIDGCGKTTQVALLAAALSELHVEHVRLREPGGNPVSEQIRGILLDPANVGMVPEAELLLYEAARAQNVRRAIEPALAEGMVVLCDRFYDSTFAYQAAARGLDEELVRTANTVGSCGVTPRRTVVLDLDPKLAWERATRGGADRLEAEGLAFQQRVREGFLRAHELEPTRISLVDASGAPEEVFARLVEALADVLPALANLDVPGFLARQADVEQTLAELGL